MNTSKTNNAILKDQAKQRLAGNYGIAVLICILYIILLEISTSVETFFSEAITNTFVRLNFISLNASLVASGINALISGILLIFVNITQAGLAFFFLKLYSHQRGMTSDLYFGFREDSRRYFILSALVYGPQALLSIPYVIVLTYVLEVKTTESIVLFIILFATSLILQFVYSVFVGPIFYFAIDFNQKNAIETFMIFMNKMKGNRLAYFKLLVSFIPMILLSILSFGLGLLWVYPYMQETIAIFYLDMMKDN